MMANIYDGGPAYPTVQYDSYTGKPVNQYGGLSIRDYFAGQILGGIIAANEIYRDITYEQAAEIAYSQADAMLKARESK